MTNYTIRKAEKTDSAIIAKCLFLAMKDIAYYLFGTQTEKETLNILEQFITCENNQYSYNLCWIVQDQNKKAIAATNVYNGAKLHTLRKAVIDYNQKQLGRTITIEDETQEGEHYIDCMGVLTEHQGKGIGSLLFQFLIEHYTQKQAKTLGLLVDLENPQAKKLYTKLGFEVVGTKKLAGKTLEHMQIKHKP